MKSRFIRITIMPKAVNSDVEISGFKLFLSGNQVDISAATVRLNFTPVSGTPDIVTRSTIVEGEALVVPSVFTRGNSYIYIDLGSEKVFDTFQIGFGSTAQRSATKIRLDLATNAAGTSFQTWEEISKQLRLKFKTPWTFSGKTEKATSGFPAFMMQPFVFMYYPDLNVIENKNAQSYYMFPIIGNDLRSIYNNRNTLPVGRAIRNVSTAYGSLFFIPISTNLDRGKYYFELSSTYGVNEFGGDGCSLMGIVGDQNGLFHGWNQVAFTMNLLGSWSGTQQPLWGAGSNSGVTIPPNPQISNIPGGRKGVLCGFSIDSVNGIIKVENPAISFPFQYNGTGLVNYFTSKPLASNQKIYFFICTEWSPAGNPDTDLQFNFGQEPFKGPVPTGFDDRIGFPWEMELDPDYNYNLDMRFSKASDIVFVPPDLLPEAEASPPQMPSRADVISQGPLDYYIKGKVKDVAGKFPKRTLILCSYPDMVQMRKTVSSTNDGTYEFLNLYESQYAIISQDLMGNGYADEILAPIKATKMDPDL